MCGHGHRQRGAHEEALDGAEERTAVEVLGIDHLEEAVGMCADMCVDMCASMRMDM